MSDAYDAPGSAREMGYQPDTGEVCEPSAAVGNPLVELFPATGVRVPAEIIKAKVAVMKACHNVAKSGFNKFHGYAYTSDADILSVVQPAMVEAGLALEMWPVKVSGPDDFGNMTVVWAMQWQHESGAISPPLPWVGVAQDRDKSGKMGDKWLNKAATAAQKYWFLKQFHIPAGGEPDTDADEPAPAAAEKPPARAKATRGSSKKADKPAGPTDDEIAKLLPKKPGFITVPHIETADGEAPNWELWGRMLSVAIQRSQEITDVNGWMDGNEQPLANMALKEAGNRPQWRDALIKRAEFRRAEIAQAPAPENAA